MTFLSDSFSSVIFWEPIFLNFVQTLFVMYVIRAACITRKWNFGWGPLVHRNYKPLFVKFFQHSPPHILIPNYCQTVQYIIPLLIGYADKPKKGKGGGIDCRYWLALLFVWLAIIFNMPFVTLFHITNVKKNIYEK